MTSSLRMADERHRYILKELQGRGSCKVSELARDLDVSEMTVHRDLAHLARLNLLRKVHGGAVLRNYIEQSFQDRAVQNHEAKVAVARLAARQVRPGSSLYLAPGSTAHELALALHQDDLHVYTNSLPTATALARSSPRRVSVTLLGGQLVGFVEALVGPATEAALTDLKLNFAFIAVTGVSLEGGLTIYTEEEARVIRAVIRAARKTVLLTDASKFGQVVGPQVGHLEDVHALVCDEMPAPYLEHCRAHDVEVLLTGAPASTERPVPDRAAPPDRRN
jgi:DeoR/GlpR family transcriptional regulator of sugar metabolism